MITCKTSNPNYYHVDSDFDLSSIESYLESLRGIDMQDDCYYRIDGTRIDIFRIKRIDILLFPELESVHDVEMWNSLETGILYTDELHKDHYMPVYALGL